MIGFSEAFYEHMTFTLLFAAILLMVPFVYFAAMERDFQFVKEHPIAFMLEVIAMGVIPASVIYCFMITRKISNKTAHKWFVGLSAKFAILHVLFQIGGFYGYWFGLGM